MANIILHRNTRIVTLEDEQSISRHCGPGDIAIVRDADGWWTCFVDDYGVIDRYDVAFESWEKAVHAAKAAAEFSAE